MQLVQNNIWDFADTLDYVCITTNSTLNKDNCLIMGKGNAKEANMRLPDLPKDFGQQIVERNVNGGFYGLLVSHKKYLAFQTKYHWRDNSPIELVERTTNMLVRLANNHPDKTFGLPFPGINNGRLKPKDVYPLLQKLPDNVFVYHLDKLDLGV